MVKYLIEIDLPAAGIKYDLLVPELMQVVMRERVGKAVRSNAQAPGYGCSKRVEAYSILREKEYVKLLRRFSDEKNRRQD